VLEAFRKLCPEEPTAYVADSGHCPYGNKPPEEIARFTKRIAGDLIARGCEVVVVACNTATAAAIGELRRTWPQIPFVGMEPAIKPAVLGTATGVVAVLATRGTFNGALYRKTAERHSGGVRIVECVPDEFVEMVERGETAGAAAEAAVRKRLEPLLAAGADRIVLGCTHFPHLKPLMEKVAAGRAEIVDSSEAVARRAKQMLDEFRRRAGRQTASSPGYTGRLAPSPTGALHLGNVRTFMIAWLRARACGGKVIMRMEDLDHPKDKPGAAEGALNDLRWLGFDWDEEYVQSRRRDFYRTALGRLIGRDSVYPCVCSRRDVESAQSAPHSGEQLFYPGTCRGRFADYRTAFNALGRSPVWRFKVPGHTAVEFNDVFAGRYRRRPHSGSHCSTVRRILLQRSQRSRRHRSSQELRCYPRRTDLAGTVRSRSKHLV
jgi:glutamate racemase